HFGPTIAEKLLQELEVKPEHRISVFPNAGRPQYFEGRYIYHPTPQYFADFFPRLVAQGARLVGGCCGTTPETIAAMARVLPGLVPIRSKPAARETRAVSRAATVAPERAPAPALGETPSATPSLLEVLRQRTL